MNAAESTSVDEEVTTMPEAKKYLNGQKGEQGMQDKVESKGTEAKKKKRKRNKKRNKKKTTSVFTEAVDLGAPQTVDDQAQDREINQPGEALKIVSFDNVGRCTLHEENLQKILLQDDIKDRQLVVVSVVGKFRQGKSFLMTLMLNHMQNQGVEWINYNDKLLDGFEWKHTSQRVTTGIMMWSRAFPLDLPTGEKVAVVFMDTQGTFDRNSNPIQNTLIFAISTMMSSVQIYNIMGNMGGDDLDHFQTFTEYGRMSREEKRENILTDCVHENDNEDNNPQEEDIFLTKPPFQHLWFLFRDWTNTNEFDLGADGGNAFLKTILDPEPKHEVDHVEKEGSINDTDFVIVERHESEMKKLIDSCFTRTECFLLPHPGLEVPNVNFKGKLSDVNQDFKKFMFAFMQRILDPSKLVIKEFGGQPVKARNFMQPVGEYVNTCRSGKLPEARNMFDSYADASYTAASEAAVDEFKNKMDAKFHDDGDCVPEDEFEKEVFECKRDALNVYYNSLKMGESEERNQRFQAGVEKAMDLLTTTKKMINECKRIKKELEEQRAELLKQELEIKKNAKDATQKCIEELKECLLSELNQLAAMKHRSSKTPKLLEEQYNKNSSFVEKFREHVEKLKISNNSDSTEEDLDDYCIEKLKAEIYKNSKLRKAAEQKAAQEAHNRGIKEQAEIDRLNNERRMKEESTRQKIAELTKEHNENKMKAKNSEMMFNSVNVALAASEVTLLDATRRQEEERSKGYLSIALGFLTSGALAAGAAATTVIAGTAAVAEVVIAGAAVVGISAAAAPFAAGGAVVAGVVGAGVGVKLLVDHLRKESEVVESE